MYLGMFDWTVWKDRILKSLSLSLPLPCLPGTCLLSVLWWERNRPKFLTRLTSGLLVSYSTSASMGKRYVISHSHSSATAQYLENFDISKWKLCQKSIFCTFPHSKVVRWHNCQLIYLSTYLPKHLLVSIVHIRMNNYKQNFGINTSVWLLCDLRPCWSFSPLFFLQLPNSSSVALCILDT